MAVLVTGGAGFIGSHASVALLQAGKFVVVADNFSNSCPAVLERIEKISGEPVTLEEVDLRNAAAIKGVFSRHNIEAVMHFAGLKAVGESVQKPELYYQNNVEGSQNLFAAMDAAGVRDLIFSSSATVYGDPDEVPIKEGAAIRPASPYGENKVAVEQLLMSQAKQISATPWRIALLRYFNPVGAHPSGLIGEDPNDIPNNLLPYITKVAIGALKELSIFGDDYPTPDGTGVRDYIHVMDLVEGHLAALQWLQQQDRGQSFCEIFNLGTGSGRSVLEVVHAFEQESEKKIPYKIANRRAGDVPSYYADPTKAEKILGWKAKRNLGEMMHDAWHWQKNNPNGYRS